MTQDSARHVEELANELKSYFTKFNSWDSSMVFGSYEKIAIYIIEDRRRIVEKVNNAYHAVRSHRSYGNYTDSTHLERAEDNLKETLKLAGIE